MKEIWKKCVECPVYEVSNLGNVRRSPNFLHHSSKPFINLIQVSDKRGYRRVCLSNRNKHIYVCVHKLVASSFIGKRKNGLEINHKDANKANNSVSNLEYVTPRQNKDHAMSEGLYVKGVDVNTCKLTVRQVKEIRKKFPLISQGKLSKEYGINQAHISRIIRREAWASVL